MQKNHWYGIFKSIGFCNSKGSQRVPTSWQCQVFLRQECNLSNKDMCEHVQSIGFCKCKGSQRVLNMHTCLVFPCVVVYNLNRPPLCSANMFVVLFRTGPRVNTKLKKCVSRILTSYSQRKVGEPFNYYQRLLRGMPARLAKCRANKFGPCGK